MPSHGRMFSFSQQYCVIYNLPLLSSCKYDDIVVRRCDKQHFYVLYFVLVVIYWPGGAQLPPYSNTHTHADGRMRCPYRMTKLL